MTDPTPATSPLTSNQKLQLLLAEWLPQLEEAVKGGGMVARSAVALVRPTIEGRVTELLERPAEQIDAMLADGAAFMLELRSDDAAALSIGAAYERVDVVGASAFCVRCRRPIEDGTEHQPRSLLDPDAGCAVVDLQGCVLEYVDQLEQPPAS